MCSECARACGLVVVTWPAFIQGLPSECCASSCPGQRSAGIRINCCSHSAWTRAAPPPPLLQYDTDQLGSRIPTGWRAAETTVRCCRRSVASRSLTMSSSSILRNRGKGARGRVVTSRTTNYTFGSKHASESLLSSSVPEGAMTPDRRRHSSSRQQQKNEQGQPSQKEAQKSPSESSAAATACTTIGKSTHKNWKKNLLVVHFLL